MNFINSRRLDRRTFLRAGAVSLSLPLLDAMLPAVVGAQSKAQAKALQPQRMVLIHRPLGTFHPFLFPDKDGPDYEATRFLKLLEPHRGRFTVISGMGHVGYPNSHHTESAIFTGVAPEGTQTMMSGLAQLRRLWTLRMKCLIISSATSKSAMTPSRKGLMA